MYFYLCIYFLWFFFSLRSCPFVAVLVCARTYGELTIFGGPHSADGEAGGQCVSGSGRPRAVAETKRTDRWRRQKKKSSPNLVWPDVHCVRFKRLAKYLKIPFFGNIVLFPFSKIQTNFPNVLREFFRGAFGLQRSWDTPKHSNALASVWNFNGTTRVQRPGLPNKRAGREKGSKIGYKNERRPEEEKKKD